MPKFNRRYGKGKVAVGTLEDSECEGKDAMDAMQWQWAGFPRLDF